MDRPPIRNIKMSNSYGGYTIESRVKSLQLLALGHVWRRDMHSPVRNLAMDRFFKPRTLAGARRRGVPRAVWYPFVLRLAVVYFEGIPLFNEYVSNTGLRDSTS
eukprot:5728556-Alexandrium_andersonii.AAC.1